MSRFRLPLSVSMLLVFLSVMGTSASEPVFSARRAAQEIRIDPAIPIFSQPFVVTVSGEWPNACVPAFHSLTLMQNSVSIEAKTPDSLVTCTEGPTNWGFSLFVPPHRPDFYVALLVVISGITGETITSTSQDFEVMGGIQIIPVLPQITEEVTVRLADLSLDSCTPQYVSHSVNTQTITIEAQIPDLVCGQVPTPWQMDAVVGPLSAGEQQVEMFVTDARVMPPLRTRLLNGSFVVAETIYTIYLPLLGCFGAGIPPQVCNTVQPPARRGVLS